MGLQSQSSKKCMLCFLRKYSKAVNSSRYSNTILLPKTTFPSWIDRKRQEENDLMIQEKCSFDSLYKWQQQQQQAREKTFILHDGPPYANGKTHFGHALNKILKDITNRYKLLRGFKVHYVPGWDCHGLPIELKALANVEQNVSPMTIRETALKFAQSYISIQMKSFQRWGIMADWTQPYVTFDKRYVAQQLSLFYQLYEKGLIYRDYKPVFWSPSTRTALAEAELEYHNNHESLSAYIKFELKSRHPSVGSIAEKVYALVWTTTPWTIPANQGICFSQDRQYCTCKIEKTGELILIALELKEKLGQLLSTNFTVISNIEGRCLVDCTYVHPLDFRELPFLAAKHITMDKGTGLSHTAPAHGLDDYVVALEHKLPLHCLIDEDGQYQAECGPLLAGKKVLEEGNAEVLKMLGGSVVHTEMYKHSYPYDWRSKKPIIIRASRQWFIDTGRLKDSALRCLEDVKVLPESLRASLAQHVETRPHWCISRQRVWGVPIPVFYESDGKKPILNRTLLDHLIHLLDIHGSDFWWSLPVHQLLPDYLHHDCGVSDASGIHPGKDIMDIWIDSGSSWAHVLKDLGGVADLYIEGTDQLRGWFQSSLLLSAALQGKAPYRTLFVHGFVLDNQGTKMSKSLGNVVDPDVVVSGGKDKIKDPPYGINVLRWWVSCHASSHHNSLIGKGILEDCSREVKKIRGVLRYLLGVLFDFKLKNAVEVDNLCPLDQYMLHLLYHYSEEMMRHFDSFQYNRAAQLALTFITTEVSAFYCHLVKDRLYCEFEGGHKRRSCQTVINYTLDVLLHSIAPLIPHLAEEVILNHKERETPLFKTLWNPCPQSWNKPDLALVFGAASEIRTVLNKTTAAESINTQECDVIISASEPLFIMLQTLQKEYASSHSSLCELLQVSEVALSNDPAISFPSDWKEICGSVEQNSSSQQFSLYLNTARRHLCPRCRRYLTETMNEPCHRCMDAISGQWA